MISLHSKTFRIFLGGLLLLVATVIYDNFFVTFISAESYERIFSNLRNTVAVMGVLYIAAGLGYHLVNRNVKNLKTKLYLLKVVTAFTSVTGILIGIVIWIEDRQTFSTYFGFITIAIAVSFQDLFRNIVGSIIINTTRNIEIGDQIEVNGHLGKVVDIGFFYTTLLEVPSWQSVDQITNREIKLPNQVFNNQMSKSYDVKDNYIWDEVIIKLPAEADLTSLEKQIYILTKKEMGNHEQPSKKFLQSLHKNIVGNPRGEDWTVKIYFDIQEESIFLTLRYLAHNKEVRLIRSNLIKKINPILRSLEKKIEK